MHDRENGNAPKRAVKLYREKGVAGFYEKPKPRGPAVLTAEVLKEAQEQLDEGLAISEVAERIGVKPNTLAKMRVYGNGPKYRKHGFRVLYAFDDLNAWSEASKRSSTSEVPDE